MFEEVDLTFGQTKVKFCIKGLGNGLCSDEGKDSCWCLIDILIKNRWFDYWKSEDEIIDYGELISLRDALQALLNDEIDKDTIIEFIEPDLEFHLHPKYDRRESSVYVKEGYEIQDISADLVINLFDSDGYNGESYKYPLDRREIEILKTHIDNSIPLLDKIWENYEKR